jgi:hypothetical protein
MLSYADYRRKRIQESIHNSQSFSETFDKYFDLMKSELLGTFQYPKVLIESSQDEDFQKLVEAAYKLTKLEDYRICSEIIDFYVRDCYNCCTSIVENASSAIDSGDPLTSVKNRVSQQIQTVIGQIKQLVTQAIDGSRQEAPSTPSVDPAVTPTSTPVAPAASDNQLPPVTIAGQTPKNSQQTSVNASSDNNGKISVPNRKGFWGWLKKPIFAYSLEESF